MMILYRMKMLSGMLLLALSIPVGLQAQDDKGFDPVSRTYALTNINIVQGPGRKIDLGTLVVKDGLILSVGKNVTIPAEAIIIKADSMYVYAGFIDGLSRTGVTKPKEDQNRERPKDPGNPPPDEAGITPQQDVRTLLNPKDKSIEELRNLGFTVAHVVPYGGMLPGNGAIILLGGNSANDMVLVSNSSFYSELQPARRMYPATVMGVMAKYRELYRQASQAKAYASLYASNRSGIKRPESDRILEAFYPVIDKRLPVLFKAEKVIEAQRVLTLQNDLGFSLMMADLKEGWDILSKVKAANAKVFLSLDLPEEKKEDKKEDKKKEGEKEAPKDEKKPATPADIEKEALEKRKAEFVANYVGQASTFHKAGIKFGFATLNAKLKDIPANLRRMIEAGLSEDAALASLTTSPAELLGLSDRLGTIDNGKIANLVVSDKPYFTEKSKVRYVFVDGTLYELEAKEEKKSDPNAKAEASGDWSYSTETPQGTSNGVVKIRKERSGYSGTIKNDRMGTETELKDVSLDGNTLSFSFSFNMGGNEMKVEVSGTITGNEFEGSMSVGQFGSFPMQAKKDPK
jgi:imidazolonepropionase-like amidohydrolase